MLESAGECFGVLCSAVFLSVASSQLGKCQLCRLAFGIPSRVVLWATPESFAEDDDLYDLQNVQARLFFALVTVKTRQ